MINGAFALQRVTGPQRYAIEIGRRLLREDSVRIVAPTREMDWVPGDRLTVRPGLPHDRAGWLWAAVALPRAIRSGEVLWSATPRAPLGHRDHIVTLHDVAVLEHPEWYARAFHAMYGFALPRLAKSAALIVTSSVFSKGRIVDVLGVSGDRIRVVYGGVGPGMQPAPAADIERVRARYQLPPQFVLALGTLQPRKNLGRLIDAWSRLPLAVRREWPLVLTGATSKQFAVDRRLEERPSDGPRFIGYVNDEDLPGLYTAASLFTYPSLYEGFGLPPLEAMACGTPVLAGRSGAAEEILGDRALLVDPFRVHAFAEGLESLLTDASNREELARRGAAHAKAFTWDKAAGRMLPILQSVASR